MNVLDFLFATHKNRAIRKRSIQPSINFPELPADVLPIILGELVEEHRCFKPPGEVCYGMKRLLELRTVCRAFDNEITRLLYQRIQFPNLRRSFHHTRMLGQLDWPTCRAWNKILAAALYNSTLLVLDWPPSLRPIRYEYELEPETSSTVNNMPFATRTIFHYICKCLSVAQNVLGDNSIYRRNEIVRTLCEALSELQASISFLAGTGPCHSEMPNSADIYCIAAIVGCVSFLENEAKKEDRRLLIGSVVFGSPLSCAIIGGNIEMVEFLTDPSTVPHVLVGKQDIESVIARQNLPMLEILLKVWIADKSYAKDGKGQVYLREMENFGKRVVELGSADMERTILSYVDQTVIAKMQLNRRNMNIIEEHR